VTLRPTGKIIQLETIVNTRVPVAKEFNQLGVVGQQEKNDKRGHTTWPYPSVDRICLDHLVSLQDRRGGKSLFEMVICDTAAVENMGTKFSQRMK
jgi:hypothetical protein